VFKYVCGCLQESGEGGYRVCQDFVGGLVQGGEDS